MKVGISAPWVSCHQTWGSEGANSKPTATARVIADEEIMSGPSSEKRSDAEIRRLVEEHVGQIEAAAKRVLGPHYAQAIDDLRQAVRIAIWRALEKG